MTATPTPPELVRPRDLFEPGQLVAERYRIDRLVGRGGTGEVYAARDEHLRVKVALKALLPTVDSVRRQRILHRELRLARQITHPGVCRMFDMGSDGPIAFVTMELLAGETLADRLARDGVMTTDAVTPLLEHIVAGLDAAHSAGVVHGDFKPHNVILVEGSEPRAVITDFGLARAPDAEASVTTHSHAAGSPSYMAPEQVLGKPATIASDIYALGVTLFQLVTGALPFAASSPVVEAMRRVDEEAPRASYERPGLDRRWDDAIARCLARDPAARFASAEHVLAAIRAPQRRTSRHALVAAVGALVIAAVVATWVLTRSSEPRRPPLVWRRDSGPIAMAMQLGADRWGMIQTATLAPDGDLLIVGHLEGGATIGGRRVDARSDARKVAYAARLDRDGYARWVRVIGNGNDSHGNWLALDGDQVYVVGHHSGGLDLGGGVRLAGSPRETSDCWIGALDARTGVGRWVTGCEASDFGHARRVVVDGQGGVYVVGEVTGDVRFGTDVVRRTGMRGSGRGWFVAAYERDGRLRWATVSDGTLDSGRTKGIVVAGDHLLFSWSGSGRARFGGADVASNGGTDAWLGAMDLATGAVRWIRRYGGNGNEQLTAPSVLPDGRIAASVGFTGEIELVPGERLRSRGLEDFMIVVFDAKGTPLRTWLVGSETFDGLAEVAVTPQGLVGIGRTQGTAEIAGHKLPPTGAFVIRVDPDGDRVETHAFEAPQGSARSIVPTARGTVLVVGRFRRELRTGELELRAVDYDGYLLELRDMPPPR